MTLQTHQNGIPLDITKFSVYQRKNLYAKMCEGKRQYFSEKSATIAMNTVKDHTFERCEIGLNVYICPFCGWWHFGHAPWDAEKLIGDAK